MPADRFDKVGQAAATVTLVECSKHQLFNLFSKNLSITGILRPPLIVS